MSIKIDESWERLLAEEFNLEEDFLDKLWEASKGQWINYSDLSGTVFFKVLEEV